MTNCDDFRVLISGTAGFSLDREIPFTTSTKLHAGFCLSASISLVFCFSTSSP